MLEILQILKSSLIVCFWFITLQMILLRPLYITSMAKSRSAAWRKWLMMHLKRPCVVCWTPIMYFINSVFLVSSRSNSLKFHLWAWQTMGSVVWCFFLSNQGAWARVVGLQDAIYNQLNHFCGFWQHHSKPNLQLGDMAFHPPPLNPFMCIVKIQRKK